MKAGKLLCWRIGPVRPVRQRDAHQDGRRRNPRAPESRGMWAFPWPYMDMYFACYQLDALLPRLASREYLAELRENFEAGQLSEQEYHTRLEASHALSETHWKRPEIRAQLRPRKFWVAGELYSHLGEQPSADSEWGRQSVSEFYELLRRQWARDLAMIRGTDRKYFDRPPTSFNIPGGWPCEIDHLEIFLGRGARIS